MSKYPGHLTIKHQKQLTGIYYKSAPETVENISFDIIQQNYSGIERELIQLINESEDLS